MRACSTPKPASLREVLNSTAVSCGACCGSFMAHMPQADKAASAAAGSALSRYTVGRFTPVALAI
jgi:hypothetical protein